ncbi:FkbM family methyltransferase [Chryseobacterium oryctis]|uniref:FkbM family methyltransferase n=1 Tax=Chryseobacterium oryctis TaxID=2952618 RepID=A0ABT3HR31_9FLAO|nr:FkbM family methyltransferase [Chryseobacterium oryctis]MCW3162242.1 FkbM family methyltransferase [Chryseobacterium oryctis]
MKTLVAFIVNSKRYSSKFKENKLDLNNNETFIYNFKQNKSKFDLYLRTFKGDIDIFYEIFWKKTYDKHLSLLGQEPKVIIDLGAHIGMTSIYFALKYPNAKIISVEASLENFLMLKQNTSSFKNIECINAAAYFEDGTVYFGNDKLSYNQSISEKGRETKAVSVETLMKNYNFAKIDLLKIDIEGGEIELLSKNNSWLTNVDNIIIEIHRPYTRENLHNDLKPFDFKVKFEENFVLFANKLE